MKRFCSSCGLYSTALCSQTGGYEAQSLIKKNIYIIPAQAATCHPSPDCPLEGRKKNRGDRGGLMAQSSEMDSLLKMGRRLFESRVGESDPLRLPELKEPLR